jgi:amino acid permease
MLSTAYVCHYNAPKFYNELKERNLSTYSLVIRTAFTFSMLVYIVMMSIGFLTFGGHSTGFILNNYSNYDSLATIARIAIGFGIICTYPLTFTALRDTIMDFFNIDNSARANAYLPITATLLGLITGLSLVVTNVGKVVSVSGALIGSLLIYIIPMIMNIAMLNHQEKLLSLSPKGRSEGSWKLSSEKALNYGLILMGMIMAVIGMKQNLK